MVMSFTLFTPSSDLNTYGTVAGEADLIQRRAVGSGIQQYARIAGPDEELREFHVRGVHGERYVRAARTVTPVHEDIGAVLLGIALDMDPRRVHDHFLFVALSVAERLEQYQVARRGGVDCLLDGSEALRLRRVDAEFGGVSQ